MAFSRAVDLTPEQHWTCPNCVRTHITREARPHTPFHNCRGLRGLSAPFVPESMDCKVESREREDYVGRELVTTDGEARPVMSIVTTRADGSNDCAVLAPCAGAVGGS
jgi:hypothetical protein